MKKSSRKMLVPAIVMFVLISALTAGGIIATLALADPTQTLQVEQPPAQASEEPIKPVTPDSAVRLIGVGDNLIHLGIYGQASRRAGKAGGYDFFPAYENVAGEIASADIATINQETVMSAFSEPSAEYPKFNSPQQLGTQLVQMGFDVISLANNHMLDMGEKGLVSTLDFWGTQPATIVGAYRNTADAEKIRTLEKNGITFGFVSATESTNGILLGAGSEMVLPTTGNRELIFAQIKRAKAACEVVVVNIHWGTEYTHLAGEKQKNLALELAEAGADIIIGHHPHVIQSMEYITRANGTRAIVVYSLGNFLSAQQYAPRMLGGMLDVTVKKSGETGEITIDSPHFRPIVTHYDAGYANIRSYMLKDYTKELANKHGCRIADSPEFSLDYLIKTVRDVIPSEFLEESYMPKVQ